MAQPAGSLFGLIHDIGDRRQAAKVRDAKRNFLTDPEGSIAAVNQINPDEGIALDAYATQRAAQQLAAQQTQQTNEATRYRTALTGVVQSLKGVRDKGGDLGAAYDSLTPAFQNGFRMKPEEIAQYRQAITTNPALLDQLEGALVDPKDRKPILMTPGSSLASADGSNILQHNAATPKTVSLKRPDGGTDLYVVDENGNLVQSQTVNPAGGPASVTGNYAGPRAIDPQARGVRNGNPGNIKDGAWAKKQPGYIGSDGTFAKFAPGFGEKAQETLLGNHYVNGQRNVAQIVNKYLGGTGNAENSAASQANYRAYVAGRLGISENDPVPPAMLPQLAQAMREFENGGGPAPSGGPKPVVSTPGAGDGWRDLNTAEKQARGLDPNKAYQIGLTKDNRGKVVPVPGQGSPGAKAAANSKNLTPQQRYSVVNSLERIRDEARALRAHPAFNQATGSIQGRLPSVFQGSRDFDTRLGSYKDNTVISALQAMKANSPNGASGFGSLQLKEGERLENATGSLDPSSPENLTRTLRNQEHDAMISIGMNYGVPPEAVQFLLQNPKTAAQFDAKFGAGMSRRIRGQ